MIYPYLKRRWAFPTPHEREIYKTLVYEIFYDRLLLTLIFIIFFSFFLSTFFSNISLIMIFGLIIVFFVSTVLLLLPLFLKPWDLLLSNKRLILRHRYWFSARFTTIKSLFVRHLESEKVTPRIKIGTLLLGFLIMQSFSLVLIEFGFTAQLTFPLYIGILFLIGGLLGVTNQFESDLQQFSMILFSPFLDYALLIGFGTLILALGLIIFSLPYRTVMSLMTTGGHQIQLNAGIPDELSNLVYSVSRKHHVLSKEETRFKWDIPLLEDEEILSYGRVGLINRGQQILGIFSLLILFQSLDLIYNLLLSPSLGTIIVMIVQIFNVGIIVLSIIFAKRYNRIIATNHRLLFQEERINVSGLWGKRIYQYSDLQKKHLQGFSVGRFTGITYTSLFGIVVLAITAILLYNLFGLPLILYLCFVIITLYFLFSYRAFTRLEFQSISGFMHILDYSLPLIIERIAHRIGEFDWLYNLIFANILTETDIIRLCNDIRDNSEPIKKYNHQERENITEEFFLHSNEPKLQTWNKIGPAPYIRTSIVLGSILAIIAIVLIFPYLKPDFQIIFVVVSLLSVSVLSLRKLIMFTYTLILTPSRVFLVQQKLPRRLAKLFGVLPEWNLHEVQQNQIISTRFKYILPSQNIVKFVLVTILLVISIFLLSIQENLKNFIPIEIVDLTIFLLAFLIILCVPFWTQQLIGLIPRFSLIIFTRFGSLHMPYIKGLNTFSIVIGEQLELFVDNAEIIRI